MPGCCNNLILGGEWLRHYSPEFLPIAIHDPCPRADHCMVGNLHRSIISAQHSLESHALRSQTVNMVKRVGMPAIPAAGSFPNLYSQVHFLVQGTVQGMWKLTN